MMSRITRLLRSTGAILAGYVALILLTTAVQEGLFGGVSFQRSSLPVLIGAGLLTPLAGVGAGYLAGRLAGTRPYLHVLPMCIAVAIETTFLYRSGRVDGPLWFEAMAGAALIAGIVAGAALTERRTARTDPV